jgi:voltage-gated potassium channel
MADGKAAAAGMKGPGSLRHRAYLHLEPAARRGQGLSLVNAILVIMILVAAGAAILETEPLVSAGRESLFRLLELIFGIAFLLEYAARLWIAPENPAYARARSPRLKYALTPIALIDLAAVLPALFMFSSGSTLVLRFFRILRILRLAKLGRTSQALRHIVEAVRDRRHELMLTAGIVMIAMLISGSLLYWAEADAQPDKFGSIPRALWWAIVTLTTVGYGDVYPVTVLGRIFGGMFAILGVCLIALPTGIFASSFSDALQRHREKVARGEDPDAPGPDA